MNWWIEEVSDPVRWDVDGLGIIDPRQIAYIIDLCDALREYGFEPEVLDRAFFTFAIDRELKGGRIRLARVRESLLEGEDRLFALPDIMDEDKGPYADFLDQITKARVKLLNDLISFDQSLTIDDLEEEIRDRQSGDFLEGRAVHFFAEITSILEYVPEGFELDVDEEVSRRRAAEGEVIEDLGEFEEEEEEKIEEDETMKWDEDDAESGDEEEGFGEEEDDLDGFEDDDDAEEEEAEEEDDDAPPARGRGKRR